MAKLENLSILTQIEIYIPITAVYKPKNHFYPDPNS